MDQERATIHSNVMDWLDNPRRKRMKRLKRFKNVRQSANSFKGVLERFSPDDLKVDPLFEEFIEDLENEIKGSVLAQSTLDGYLGYLTGKVLVYGGVEQSIVEETKTFVTVIQKGLRKRRKGHRTIEDDEVLDLLKSLDEMCDNPEAAPNLSRIANPKSSNAKAERTSLRLLLALRAYAYLVLVSAARADSIRRIRISEVSEAHFVREILKMRTYTEEVRNQLPSWAFSRVEPYLEYCRENHPDAEFLFSENENVMGLGTISPKTLRELVKGSMVRLGMESTSRAGYYRFHDLRRVWARWMDRGGASLEEITAFFGHSSPRVPYEHYYADDHKKAMSDAAWKAGMGELEALMKVREKVDLRIDELYDQLDRVGFFSDGEGGGVYPSWWDEMDPAAMDLSHMGIGEGDSVLVRAPGLEPGTP